MKLSPLLLTAVSVSTLPATARKSALVLLLYNLYEFEVEVYLVFAALPVTCTNNILSTLSSSYGETRIFQGSNLPHVC